MIKPRRSCHIKGKGKERGVDMQLIAQNAMPAAATLFGLALPFAGCGGGSQISSLPTNASPQLASLSPGSVIVGGASFTLTVNGSHLTSSASVRWNDQPLPTAFVSSQQVTALISSS